MNKHLFLIFTSLSFLFVACNRSGGESDSTKASKTKASVKNAGSPCEIITLNDIKEFFKIQDTMEVSVSNKSVTFPMCSYEWGEDVVKNYIKIGDIEREYGAPAKVTIVMVKGVSNGDFKQSTSVYKDPEDISGIGEMAKWSPKMSQLSFLVKGTLFHVNVKASSDKEENKSNAIKLSELILQKG